jgi:hypothetical protein
MSQPFSLDLPWNYQFKDVLKFRYGDCELPFGYQIGQDMWGQGDECMAPLQGSEEFNIKKKQEESKMKDATIRAFSTLAGRGGYTKAPLAPSDKQPQIPTVGPTNSGENFYVEQARRYLRQEPHLLMGVFFSDTNINHIRQRIVDDIKRVKGIQMQLPQMDHLFQFMIKAFAYDQNFTGSICFVNFKSKDNVKNKIAQLNTEVIQEYTSHLISQMDMYTRYYKDASTTSWSPLELPTLATMKGSRVLEQNVGFTPGNSEGVASYNIRNTLI